jgi:ATP-dependent helicase/DNAse subunit B
MWTQKHRHHDSRTAEERAIQKERLTHLWRVFIAVMVSASSVLSSVLIWAFFTKIKETVQTEMAPVVARQEADAKAAEARLKAYLEITRYERETLDLERRASAQHTMDNGRLTKLEEISGQNREMIRNNYEKILEQLRALDVKVSEGIGRRNSSGGGGD